MITKTALIGMFSLATLAISSAGAAAETALAKAISDGAQQLSSDEIAELLVGKTVTFVSASGDKEILVHYGEDNVISGKLIGGDWSGTGYYGIADDDSVCLSWDERDKGRLRCLSVLIVDGVAKKFKADGSLSGSLVKFQDGKMF